MWKFTVIAFLAILAARRHAEAVCNQCRNGFTCVSERNFQVCFNNRPDTNRTFTCPNRDDICTRYGAVCMPKDNGVTPACRGLQNCVCDNAVDYQFVCTSRTTFTMCYNKAYTTTRGTCPSNQICSVQKAANNEYPCDSQCIEEVDNAAICDFIDPVDVPAPETTTSATPATTATTATNATTATTATTATPTPSELCGNANAAGRYAIPNDTACTNYTYCYFQSNQLVGRNTPCPNGRYFNRDIKNCQIAKPSWCV